MTVLIRIGLRYAAAALVAKGLLSPGMGEDLARDPEIAAALQIGAGALAAAAAEGWYFIAKRFGWKT